MIVDGLPSSNYDALPRQVHPVANFLLFCSMVVILT